MPISSESELKYFYIFKIEPSTSILGYFPLKKGCITCTFISIAIIFGIFLLELFHSNENGIYIFFKHFVYSLLNFFAFILMLKSQYNFEYKKAYLGYLSFLWAFGLHSLLFMINILGSHQFSSINLFFLNIELNEKNKYIYLFVLPNFLYLLYELYISWVCYSYAKNLEEGKDALVDGLTFDRYSENFENESESDNHEISYRDRNILFSESIVKKSASSRKKKSTQSIELVTNNLMNNVSNFDGLSNDMMNKNLLKSG